MTISARLWSTIQQFAAHIWVASISFVEINRKNRGSRLPALRLQKGLLRLSTVPRAEPLNLNSEKERCSMSIKSLMSSSPDFAEPQETAYQAAIRMRQRAVGSLIIVNEAYSAIGIITDRDLVERVVAAGKDPSNTQLADIMTKSPVTVCETEEVDRALQLMQQHSVRRIPVEDELGRVCGLLALDDVIAAFAVKCQGIAQLLKSETPRGVAEDAASRWE